MAEYESMQAARSRSRQTDKFKSGLSFHLGLHFYCHFFAVKFEKSHKSGDSVYQPNMPPVSGGGENPTESIIQQGLVNDKILNCQETTEVIMWRYDWFRYKTKFFCAFNSAMGIVAWLT